MKILDLKKEKATITREVVSKVGETMYHSPDVTSIEIAIKFKDGSSIGFKREESDDDFKRIMEDK